MVKDYLIVVMSFVGYLIAFLISIVGAVASAYLFINFAGLFWLQAIKLSGFSGYISIIFGTTLMISFTSAAFVFGGIMGAAIGLIPYLVYQTIRIIILDLMGEYVDTPAGSSGLKQVASNALGLESVAVFLDTVCNDTVFEVKKIS